MRAVRYLAKDEPVVKVHLDDLHFEACHDDDPNHGWMLGSNPGDFVIRCDMSRPARDLRRVFVREIAARLGYDRSTVLRHRREFGLHRLPHKQRHAWYLYEYEIRAWERQVAPQGKTAGA